MSNQHVVPHGDKWAVKPAGADKVTKIVDTQREAIEVAKERAKNQESELFIHNQKGQIRERNTYGKDKCPPEG